MLFTPQQSVILKREGIDMGNILVLGACGFIGAATCKELSKQDIEWCGIDNWSNNKLINDFRFDQFTNKEQKLIEDYAIDESDFIDLMDYDAVIHLAAIPGVRHSIDYPDLYYQNNLMETIELLDRMRRRGIKKLVFASTSSVYDWKNAPHRPIGERTQYIKPCHPYAGSKLAAEQLCRMYHELYGMDITVLRYFTVYGPSGRPDMFPLRAVRAVCDGLPLKINGDGKQERDFTYIDDVVKANLAALDLEGFQIINVGCGDPSRLIDLIRMLEDITGKAAIIDYRDSFNIDVPFTWADKSLAIELGLMDFPVHIETGLEATVKWYMDNRDALRDVEF